MFIHVTVEATCAAGEFTCANGNCVSTSLQNDGWNDCNDNSDEGEARKIVISLNIWLLSLFPIVINR